MDMPSPPSSELTIARADSPPPTGPVARWLLGEDWKQRLRTRRSLKGAAGYALLVALLQAAPAFGLLPATPVNHVTLAVVLLVGGVYGLLRSGINLQFKDPSLTLLQMMAPATLTAWIYSFAGPWRDLILVALAPVLLFGFRHLRAAKVRLLGAYSLAAVGGTMAWLVVTQPQAYDMAQELLRFMLVALVVITLWQYTSSDTEDTGGWTRHLLTLLMTDDPRQRLRIQRFLVAAANFVICTIVLTYAVSIGAVDARWGHLLSAYMMGNVAMFYLLLRSGVNLRFADPALTLPQILIALTCVVGAYAILEGSRGACLILLALVLVFGMFNLDARQTRLAAFFALALQGGTMLLMALLAPQRYTPRQELINFLFACTSLPTISLLSGQLSELRKRLQARKDELAEALERIQMLATRDELTGLFNRRHMMETLHLQKKFCARGARSFCIALLDIDHFKHVNDTHGHGVGDEVLRQFAQSVQLALRDSDVIARWGGEEFMVMLSDCRLDQAEAGLARVRERLADVMVSSTVPGLRITFSAGLAEQRHDETLDQSIERADQALYRAKRGGRDRTELA